MLRVLSLLALFLLASAPVLAQRVHGRVVGIRGNSVQVRLSPELDVRPNNIEALVRHFLQLAANEGLPRRQLTPGAAELLSRQPWRGNVRELKNFIYRLTPQGAPAGEAVRSRLGR